MDETQPLLPDSDRNRVIEEDANTDPNIVTFNPEGDEENPLEWPSAYKWAVVGLLAFMAFNVTFTCISVVPVADRIVRNLNNGAASKSASVLLVTIWELGEAAGPLLIAPLSEMYGRYPVINMCNAGLILSTVIAALSRNLSLFTAVRALSGAMVCSNVLNPAIVGDMFPPENRGRPMGLVMLASLVGGALGPLISVEVAEGLGWRAVMWMCVIMSSTGELLLFTLFRETYRVPILRRKAARIREETCNPHARSQFDENTQSLSKLRDAVLRPFIVFFDSPVLQITSLFSAVVFTFFYILSTTLPNITGNVYKLEPTITGLIYISFSVGAVLGNLINNSSMDWLYQRLKSHHKGAGRPEYRLPFVIFGSLTMPLAISFFGWTAAFKLPIPLLILGIILIGLFMQFAFLPVLAYVVDAFGLYSASALTALIVTRCLMSTFLPLATPPLVERFGYGWAFTILGAMLMLLTPIPGFTFRYGHVWRQRSKYSRDE
ncbi:MFS transporter [Xylariaceae sp. FL1272]|nr:MFS transporter [Xylariaceae sp. FL1272]